MVLVLEGSPTVAVQCRGCRRARILSSASTFWSLHVDPDQLSCDTSFCDDAEVVYGCVCVDDTAHDDSLGVGGGVEAGSSAAAAWPAALAARMKCLRITLMWRCACRASS